jgi:hypothetical protein
MAKLWRMLPELRGGQVIAAGRQLAAAHPLGIHRRGHLAGQGVTVGLGLLSSNLIGYLLHGQTDGRCWDCGR